MEYWMNISKKLIIEHEIVTDYLNLMESLLQKKEGTRRDKFVRDNGATLVDFLQQYADKYHHAKEEGILFKYLDNPDAFNQNNPVYKMIYEHDEARGFILAMVDGIEREDYDTFYKYASHYIALLRDHISMENKVFYPMAEDVLSAEIKTLILKEYEDAEVIYNKDRNLDDYYKIIYNELLSFIRII